MKRTSPLLFFISTALLIFVGISIILFRNYVVSIENDASTINDLGIIRGSIQRFSKLEITLEDNKDTRVMINDLIQQYNNENIPSLQVLKRKWNELEIIADAYRKDSSEQNKKLFLEKSEECWTAADQMVLKNQYISEHKVSYLTLPIILLAIGFIIVSILLYIIKKYVYDNLELFAIYDPLTRIFNRRYFMEYLNNEILRADRKQTCFSLVMFDIDHFKNVNDTFGHSAGDEVLKTVASVSKTTLRKSDVLSRIGGEEFTILLPDTKIDQAIVLAERVRTSIERHDFTDVKTVTISLGVSEFKPGNTPDDMLKRADAAMYKAKNTGRNRSVIG
jgi:diguanylate cyclase (GGDEF)-like protein